MLYALAIVVDASANEADGGESGENSDHKPDLLFSFETQNVLGGIDLRFDRHCARCSRLADRLRGRRGDILRSVGDTCYLREVLQDLWRVRRDVGRRLLEHVSLERGRRLDIFRRLVEHELRDCSDRAWADAAVDGKHETSRAGLKAHDDGRLLAQANRVHQVVRLHLQVLEHFELREVPRATRIDSAAGSAHKLTWGVFSETCDRKHLSMIAWLVMLSAMESAVFSGPLCVPAGARTVELAKARGIGQIRSGCRADSSGVVPCDPETMRADAERKLHQLGLFPHAKRLTMNVYAMARNIHSEGGRGSGAEKLVLGEALVNRARQKGTSLLGLMSRSGRFARQKGCNPCVSSSQDPSWDDIVAAMLVLAGQSAGISRGATHYFSPRAQDSLFKSGRIRLSARQVYDSWTSGGDLLTWVGHIPGIDTHRQMFFRKEPKTLAGRARSTSMRKAGSAALGMPTPAGILYAPQCETADDVSPVLVVGLCALAASAVFFLVSRTWRRGAHAR